FVTHTGQVKVLDFGIAKALGTDETRAQLSDRSSKPQLITHEGALVGTLPYMAPEQMTGETDKIDHRADLWAIGIILFELLAGRHPVEPLTAQRLLALAMFDEE